MIFSNNKINKPDALIKIYQKVIKQEKNKIKTGVMLTYAVCGNIQWKEHVNCVNLKISKCIATMHNLILQ